VLRLLRALIPMVLRALRALLRPDSARERLYRRLEAMLADFEARFAQASGLLARLALIRDMTGRAFDFVIPQFVPRFGMGMAMVRLLTRLAATVTGQAADVQVMMRGVPHNVTTQMDLALWETARAIRADPGARSHLQACEVAELVDEYAHGRLPRAAQGAIARFMRRYGMRGLGEIDLGRPRWREEPLPILQALRGYLDIDDTGRAPDVVYARGRRAAGAEVDRLAAALRRTRGGWLKAWLVRWAAYRMRALIGLREAPKFTVIRIFDVMRQALLADGTRFAVGGVLDRPDDVFFLRMCELEALAAGGERDWMALVRARRQSAEREMRRRQVPRLLLSDGQAFYAGVSALQAGSKTVLYGDPVSPGAVEGIVRVVRDPRSAQLVPGEILVCPGTDPSWTPLFLIAGGLVMELGGMMTHGAVVAREYGLPAVVGVDGATQRLRTGQRVRVDGSRGQVVLLEG
jgi:pyruvate,water dikinase